MSAEKLWCRIPKSLADLETAAADIRSTVNDMHEHVLSFVPAEVGDHLAAARRELLSAARAAVDEEIRWNDLHWQNAKSLRVKRETRESAEDTTPDVVAVEEEPAG